MALLRPLVHGASQPAVNYRPFRIALPSVWFGLSFRSKRRRDFVALAASVVVRRRCFAAARSGC
eukprot:5568963-Lingulodinium_polyedra.AAC.1